jgi:hypothetical protein
MAKVKRFRGGGSPVAAAAPEDKEPSRQLKSRPRQITRTLETADSGGKYPVKPSSVKADTAGGNNIIKRPASEVMSKASRAVEGELSGSLPKAASAGGGGASGNVYEGSVSKAAGNASKLGRLAGIAGRAAGPAAMAMGAKELYDSYKKYDELMPGTKPNMSKKSDPIVDAINAEPKSKAPTPDVEIKKTEIVKSAPAASKPALKSGTSKPKGPTEGDRARAAIESMRSQYESGDLYNKAGLEKSAEDENARTKTEATENMKKGGMTKRPPKPAKKVPVRKFASGGNVSRTSASKRGDGCATKGHTKGKYL